MSVSRVKAIRFGEFEVDLSGWVLKRNNRRVALQRKPFQILRLLLSRPGELVTRSEISRELWPDLHVSYDHSLNTAINELRKALEDATRESRYIETCPGLGYRFAAPVSVVRQGDESAAESDANGNDIATGYYFLHRFSSESLARARGCFNAIAETNGMHAAKQAALAEIESLTAVCGWAATREAAARALEHAQAAQAANAELPEATVAIAVASGLSRGTYDKALQECASVLERSPGCLSAQIWLAEFLCQCGKLRDSVMHFEAAKRANPFSLRIRSRLLLALFLCGDYHATVDEAWAALLLDPACAGAQYALALAYQQMGSTDDAVTEFENAIACSTHKSAAVAGLAHVLQREGRVEEAMQTAHNLEEMARSSYVSKCWHALVQLAFKDSEAAERSIREATEEGDFLAGFARHDPRFRSYRVHGA